MAEQDVLSEFVSGSLRNAETLSDFAHIIRRKLTVGKHDVRQHDSEIIYSPKGKGEDVVRLSLGYPVAVLNEPGHNTLYLVLTVSTADLIYYFEVRYMALRDQFRIYVGCDEMDTATPFTRADIERVMALFGHSETEEFPVERHYATERVVKLLLAYEELAEQVAAAA